MSDDQLRQQLQDNYQISPEQADRVIETVRQAAIIWQQTFQDMFCTITQALDAWRQTGSYKDLAATFATMLARQTGKTETYLAEYRSRLPSAKQGYNRTEYDRWRNQLGQRSGRRRR